MNISKQQIDTIERLRLDIGGDDIDSQNLFKDYNGGNYLTNVVITLEDIITNIDQKYLNAWFKGKNDLLLDCNFKNYQVYILIEDPVLEMYNIDDVNKRTLIKFFTKKFVNVTREIKIHNILKNLDE